MSVSFLKFGLVLLLSYLISLLVFVKPRFLPLLWGDFLADYYIKYGEGRVDGTVQWSATALQVQWQIQVDDFSTFPAFFSSSLSVTGHGAGEGRLVFDWTDKVLRSGAWWLEVKKISFLGASLF